MLARLRGSMAKGDEGFTLIELLVVMIIIGILAAIAIPVFLSQRAKGQDTATKADVSTVGKELATYFVDGVGAPPVVTIVAGRWQYGVAPNVVDMGKASTGVAKINETGTGATDWCIAAQNPGGSTKYWKYSAVNGLQASAVGGCP